MKINIVCVGEIKEKYFRDACGEYLKRLSRFAQVNIIEVKEESSYENTEQKKQIEGQRILEKTSGFIVLLDRLGKELTSEELSALIENKKVQGVSEFSFIIGGSNGVSEEVIKKANAKIAFGKSTFPHQLFRVMLLEQIYRALTISSGLPYHK